MARYTLLLVVVVASAAPAADPAAGSTSAKALANVGQEVQTLAQGGSEATAQPESPATADSPPVDQTPVLRRKPIRSTQQLDAAAAARARSVPWYRSGLMSLVFVLGAIGGVALLVRRLVPSMRTMNGPGLEVLGRHHLAPKQSLALVRIGRRVLLVGVSADRLNTLCEIDEPQEVAELLGRVQNRTASDEQFSGLLSGETAGFDEASDPAGELTHGPSDRLDRARDRVQGLLARLRSLPKETAE